MHLTVDTRDIDLAALSTPARTSEQRRRELDRLAGICSPRSVDVTVTLDPEAALCRPDDGDRSYEVLLPTKRYEQPVTSLPDPLWDRYVKTALLFHELGHVHYTDLERFGERLEDVPARWRDVFRAIFNAAEDGVVETQMAAEFNVRTDLLVLNETFAARADDRHRRYVDLFAEETDDVDADTLTYTVFEAISVGLLDRGFGDSGRYAEILDPENGTRIVRDGRRDVLEALDPILDAFMIDVLSEPHGATRVDRAYECFREVRDVLADLPPLQRTRIQTAAVRPRDARPVATWRVRPVDELPDESAVAGRVARTREQGDSEEASEPTQNSGTVNDEQGAGEDGAPVPGRVTSGALREQVRRQRRTTARSTGSDTSALERDAARLLEVIRDPDADVDEVVVVDPEGGDRDRWEQARADARSLTADLETRLRRERRPREKPGERAGDLDTKRLVGAYRGRDRVFSRRLPAVDKDYSCMLLLDRSGSMWEGIETAENAIAQLASGLYDVGVDVSVLSVWRGTACLELPFGGNPEDNVDRLLTGRADGGTPLHTLLEIARHRLAYGRGSVPFVIVVTDGRPNDTEAYRAELEKCSAPVYGVYVAEERTGDPAFFDHLTYASPDDLGRTLEELVRRLFAGGGD